MTIAAILFDIDGTLVDSNDQHVLAWEAAFAGIGKRLDRAVIHDQIGKGTDMLVPTLLPDLDEAAQERLGEAHGTVFKARYLDAIRPFAGAIDLLKHARRTGRQVVLASSASGAELEHYLDLLDAHDVVSATATGDEVARTKPAPDIFATALDKIAPLGARDVVVVGDTPYDVEAAARCGIRTIALRSGGFSDDALLGAGAVRLYDDVAALLADYDAALAAAASRRD